MLALKGFFPGRVDIISEGERGVAPTTVLSKDRAAADILALLGRRPCTVEDVASGIGIHVMVALKHLGGLIATGKASTVVTGGRNFFTINQNLHRDITGLPKDE